MATAECQNDDCDRDDEWHLRKDPSEYARGGPSCPDCGSTNVSISGVEPQEPEPEPQQTQQAPQQPAQAPEAQQGVPPAQASQQGAQQGAQAPAVPGDQEAVLMGAQAGEILAQAQSDDPVEQATAAGKGMKALGSLLAQYGDRKQQEAVQSNERAKQANPGDIRTADEYVECPECGGHITAVPESGEFACPHCAERLVHEPR